MKPEDLSNEQKQFLKELIKQEWTINEPPPPEPEPSKEEKMIADIRTKKDCKEIQVRPKMVNRFKNISAVVVRSKSEGKQVVCHYFYYNLKKLAKMVGREGGIKRMVIEDYKHETEQELERKYPIVSEDRPDLEGKNA